MFLVAGHADFVDSRWFIVGVPFALALLLTIMFGYVATPTGEKFLLPQNWFFMNELVITAAAAFPAGLALTAANGGSDSTDAVASAATMLIVVLCCGFGFAKFERQTIKPLRESGPLWRRWVLGTILPNVACTIPLGLLWIIIPVK